MFTLPDLPYAYDALEPYIDEETMYIHHDKHHASYIDNLNKLVTGNESLEELLKSENPKIRNNAGGHYNHSFFWEIMDPKNATSSIREINLLKDQFMQVALGHFGSGWAFIVVKDGKLEVTDTPNQDNPIVDGKVPILGIDVWEHAYYLKYKNMKADYINAWWNVVNWEQVEHNLSNANFRD